MNYPLRQKVIEAYVAGTPVKEIAKEFGIHRTTITQIALAAGLAMRNQKLSPITKQEARRLYESGLSLAKVAKQLDISPTGARDAIVEIGGTMRSPGPDRQTASQQVRLER
ncbi:helix-turn-helix domain-containing protein [Actinomycetaceae bacterium MB13-C1-2]|nr:helix-turn-helix domain-containing protein [Actinomycetaceae bacterium MB13-C1-2]